MDNRIAVLIPCYNEEMTVAKVVSDFKKYLPEAVIYVYDNNSTDRTASLAKKAGAIVHSEPNQGKGYVVTRMFADIDADVMNNGAVNAYVYNVYDVATNEGAWNALPFIYPLEVWTTNTAGERVMGITPETVRFEWEQGKVTFIIQELNGYDPEDMVQTLHFKVTVTK